MSKDRIMEVVKWSIIKEVNWLFTSFFCKCCGPIERVLEVNIITFLNQIKVEARRVGLKLIIGRHANHVIFEHRRSNLVSGPILVPL